MYGTEQTQAHGTPQFPLAVYFNPLERFDMLFCHWHPEVEIILVKAGEGVVELDGRPKAVQAGSLVFANSRVTHRAYPNRGHHLHFHAVVFRLSLLRTICDETEQDNYIEPLEVRRLLLPELISPQNCLHRDIFGSTSGLIETFNQKPSGWELQIKGCLFSMLGRLFAEGQIRENQDSARSACRTDVLRKTLSHLKDHYAETIRVEDIAQAANTSTYYYHRILRDTTGQTPINFLNSYRVHRAARQLAITDDSVLNIALSVGFNNFSHFTKTFKKHMEVTPTEYRRLYRAEETTGKTWSRV